VKGRLKMPQCDRGVKDDPRELNPERYRLKCSRPPPPAGSDRMPSNTS
jgi:hypothetical protein